MGFNTPVLLLVWRRPQTLRLVIDAMRTVAPTHVYVACDGPNPDRVGEAEKVKSTRNVIENEINWPCQVEKRYSDVNQGCRLGVSQAITWFFEQVEEGIILEDDCIPHPDFFPYCENLLDRYRQDNRIWSICGSNFQLGRKRGPASYYFSIHGDSWGWATWRRAWKNYESAKDNWVAFRDNRQMNDVFRIAPERVYWTEILDRLFLEGIPSSWAYQWWCASWMNHALHVWPNVNLVSNAGFNEEGTHTLEGGFRFADTSLEPLENIIHPDFVVPSTKADRFAFFRRRSGARYIAKKLLGPAYPVISLLTKIVKGLLKSQRR